MQMGRFSQVKSFVIKRSVNRTLWSQVGAKLGLAVLGTALEKFEEIDLSGVDLSKKQVVCLFDTISKSHRLVLKKLKIFSRYDFIPCEVFGKSVCKLEEVDLGYHRVKEADQESLIEAMVSKPHTMKRLYLHDNIAPTIQPQMVANALRNLEEQSVFGMSNLKP